jgi:hypothetical protein
MPGDNYYYGDRKRNKSVKKGADYSFYVDDGTYYLLIFHLKEGRLLFFYNDC